MASRRLLLSSFTCRQNQTLMKWGRLLTSYYFSSSSSSSSSSSAYHLPLPTHNENHIPTPLSHLTLIESHSKTPLSPTISRTTTHKLRQLGMDGNIQQMVSLCRDMIKKQTRVNAQKALHQLIDYFVISRKFKPAFELIKFAKMNTFDISPESNVLLVGLWEDKKLENGNVDNLNDFMEYILDHDRVDLALYMFRRLKLPVTSTFQTLILALCWNKNVDECITVLDQMFELNCKISDIEFYMVVLPFVVRNNHPHTAVQLIRMMSNSNITLNDMTCATTNIDLRGVILLLPEEIVNGFCNLWRFDAAANFLLEIPVFDTCPHKTLLSRYCNSGMWNDAIEFHTQMVNNNLADVDSWLIIITQLCINDEIEKSFEILRHMMTFCYQEHMRANPNSLSEVKVPHDCTFCDHQNSAGDGLVPTSAIHSMWHMFLPSLRGYSGYPQPDRLLHLAMYVMLKNGLWKDGIKSDADKIGQNAEECVAP